MKKAEIHQFNPVIYPYRLWVVINKNPDVLSERFNEYNGSPIVFTKSDGTEKMDAFVMSVQSKEDVHYGVVIFFRSKKSISYELVAHESSHAAKYLFEHIGADPRVHEPFEYVIGWMADCCYQVKTGKFKS